MEDHDRWRVRRALTVQGVHIEAVCADGQWAIRRDGLITMHGSDIEILYCYELIASTLAPSTPKDPST